MRAPLFLFAHGAGAGSAHPWMQAWRRRLETIGEVVVFDYPYVREGRRSPDRMPKLLEAHRAALLEARRGHAGPVFLAGKSMGSRVGCHLSLEPLEAPVAGLVCFGYPLQGMGARPRLRDEVLKALESPILFVQGTRDRLCPLDVLERVRGEMRAPSTLHVVPDGDHSLRVTKTRLKRDGETQDDVDERILAAVRGFVAQASAGSP